MFKSIITGIAFVAVSAQAASNFLAKTVTAEGYVSEYSVITGSGENDSLFGTYFILADSKASSAKGFNADTGLSANGAVAIQHCDRDEFSAAGYSIPSTKSVQKNVDALKEASARGTKVRVIYWDNGHPLSGKCIIRIQK